MTLREWKLQDASDNLEQVVNQAAGGEAQIISVRGKPTAVVISVEEYALFTGRKRKLSSLLLQPSLGIEELYIDHRS